MLAEEKSNLVFHEIESSIQAVFAAMDEAENPDDPAYQEALEAVLAELADAETAKADAIAYTLAKLEGDVVGIELTMQGLANRKRSLEGRAVSLRNYVLKVMQAHGIQKIKGQSATLSVRKGSQSVRIDDPKAIPTDLNVTKVEPNKAAIKAALKEGQEVPGAYLVTGPETLSVRR